MKYLTTTNWKRSAALSQHTTRAIEVSYFEFMLNLLNQIKNCYRPQCSCGKVMFSQACVKNSVHREGVCIPACIGADTPRHPRSQQQTERILLECFLVFYVYIIIISPA